MDVKEFGVEANELVREGFNSVASSWRSFATIESVENFRVGDARTSQQGDKTVRLPTHGIPQLKTYAKLMTLPAEDIQSGAYREKLRAVGRGAGTVFNNAFWSERRKGAGSGWRQLVVSFLNGKETPTVEVCQHHKDGSLTLRGYYDFGISTIADPEPPIETWELAPLGSELKVTVL